jgi:hypothetical protein
VPVTPAAVADEHRPPSGEMGFSVHIAEQQFDGPKRRNGSKASFRALGPMSALPPKATAFATATVVEARRDAAQSNRGDAPPCAPRNLP